MHTHWNHGWCYIVCELWEILLVWSMGRDCGAYESSTCSKDNLSQAKQN